MLKLVSSLAFLAAACSAEDIQLGYTSAVFRPPADDSSATYTVKVEQADLDAAGDGAQLILRLRQSVAGATYKLRAKKTDKPTPEDAVLIEGSRTNFFLEKPYPEAPTAGTTYNLHLQTECGTGECTAVTGRGDAAVSAYLGKVDGTTYTPLTYIVTESDNGYAAFQMAGTGFEAKDDLSTVTALLDLKEKKTVYFGVQAAQSNKLSSPPTAKIAWSKDVAPTTSSEVVPKTSGIADNWTDEAELEAGKYYFKLKIIEPAGSAAVRSRLQMAISVGTPIVASPAAVAKPAAFGLLALVAALVALLRQ